MTCSCPKEGGWRPGARWAREDIEALPLHRRPSIRELGRRSEAAETPFRRLRADDGGRVSKAIRPAKPCAPAKAGAQTGSPPSRGYNSPAVGSDNLPSPLVTTRRDGGRIVIAAADPAARAIGLAAGMTLAHARATVAGLDARDGDPVAETAELTRLAVFAVKRWTPFAAVSGLDGLWLDLNGVAHLFGGEERMCRRIIKFCERLGFAARIAVAGSWGAAHAIARHGPEALSLCPPGGEADAIAPLPIAALRLAEKPLATAARLGIETVGDVLAMPRGPLVRRFGKGLVARIDQAVGRLPEPIAPVVPPSAATAATRFAEPIMTAEAIGEAIAWLAAALVAELARRGAGARLIRLACRRVDGSDQHAAIAVARPTRDAAHLTRLLAMRIETIDPGFGIEAMRLVAVRADRLGAIAIDGALAGARPVPDLAQLIDRLTGRLGRGALWRASAVESDVPERSVKRVAPLAPTPLSPMANWRRDWPRPARLLSPPERIADVLALLPDSPPRRFTWRGAEHRITRGDGPERIHGEWWRRSGEADAVRDYFRVEDEAGQRFWLFRRGDGIDARTGDLGWFMQGLFG